MLVTLKRLYRDVACTSLQDKKPDMYILIKMGAYFQNLIQE